MDEYEELIPPGEVARVLGVNAKTVRRWVNEGKIAHVKTPGGHARFRPSDIEAMLRPSGRSPGQ